MSSAAVDSNGAGTEHEDTIVVKSSDDRAEHQISPESSPEPEPLAENPSASIDQGLMGNVMDLESPEPDDSDDQDEKKPTPSLEGSGRRPSLNSPKPRHQLLGTSEERLLQLPELRPLPWREGVDPASENEVGGESRRKQIRFGCLLATRGEVQKVPCTTCANGRGKFSICVALDDFFKGACASCQLSGGPNRCSRKKQDDEDESSVTRRGSGKPRKSSYNFIKRPSSTDIIPAKRRRTVEPAPEQAGWEHPKPQWQHESSQLQAPAPIRSPWSTVNQQGGGPQQSSLPYPPPNPPPPNGVNGYIDSNQRQPDRHNSADWKNPTQLPPLHNMPPAAHSFPPHQHQSLPHPQLPPPQTLLFPPTQTLQNEATLSHNANKSDIGTLVRTDEIEGYDNGIALIDTLPKVKQRQLYALVSGIQKGMKQVQTDLDLLKRALGMEDVQ